MTGPLLAAIAMLVIICWAYRPLGAFAAATSYVALTGWLWLAGFGLTLAQMPEARAAATLLYGATGIWALVAVLHGAGRERP